MEECIQLLKTKCNKQSYKKLIRLANPHLDRFIAEYAEVCNPDSIYICDDSGADAQYARDKALKNKEEAKLSIKGHTIHFDGYHDQARDKKNTCYLLPKSIKSSFYFNGIERASGLKEIKKLLKGIMVGKEMFVRFFCLGPINSPFSVLAVQITDSSYVAHSEDILYRGGYEQFKKGKD